MSETTKEILVDEYFGGCPECGKSHGYFNIGRTHFFHCDDHKTMWPIGCNLFSSWKNETDEIWRENWKKFAKYREVDPLPCNADWLKEHNARAAARAAREAGDDDLPF